MHRILVLIAACLAHCLPLDARAQGTISYANGSAGCTQASGFSYDWSTKVLNINCSTQPACSSATPGTFAIDGDGSRVRFSGPPGTRTIRIVRTGGCGGAYRVIYALTGVNLSGWSFNGTQSNGEVTFQAGETSKDLNLVTGYTSGYFYLLLVTAIPVAPTTAPTVVSGNDNWFDILIVQPGFP